MAAGEWRATDMRGQQQVEKTLIDAARKWGLGMLETGHVDDLQLLANLQHYGIPTRLLDLTSNPMTALWFACQALDNLSVSRSGVVLALDVAPRPVVESVGPPGGATWGSIGDPTGFTLESALKTTQPFVVNATVPNERLRAEEGVFVAAALPPGGLAAVLRRGPFVSVDVDAGSGDPKELEANYSRSAGRGRPSALPYLAV